MELDKRNFTQYGKERVLTVVEIRRDIAVCSSNTGKPGRLTLINLQRLTNPKLFRVMEKREPE
jgi:hypothetical protein